MRPFLNALARRRRGIFFFSLCCAVFAGSFALYGLPARAVLYPALLCAAAGLCLLIAEGRRLSRRKKLLQELSGLPAELMPALPAPAHELEDAYQDVIRALQAEITALSERDAAKYREMADYYTLWAHQIKTPIASMRLALQNEDSPLSRSLSRDLLRIEQYVDMVMAFLRLDAASTDYVFRLCPLDPIIRRAVRRFSGEFIARKLALRYEPVHTSAVTDEKWLGFVVEQVLSNALKYTREGWIAITVEEPLTLCVTDTGTGIAPEDLPRIFEKGFTGAQGRESRQASGIGLYLCERVCRNLGAEIRAASIPDRGTAIRIVLPPPRN